MCGPCRRDVFAVFYGLIPGSFGGFGQIWFPKVEMCGQTALCLVQAKLPRSLRSPHRTLQLWTPSPHASPGFSEEYRLRHGIVGFI